MEFSLELVGVPGSAWHLLACSRFRDLPVHQQCRPSAQDVSLSISAYAFVSSFVSPSVSLCPYLCPLSASLSLSAHPFIHLWISIYLCVFVSNSISLSFSLSSSVLSRYLFSVKTRLYNISVYLLVTCFGPLFTDT